VSVIAPLKILQRTAAHRTSRYRVIAPHRRTESRGVHAQSAIISICDLSASGGGDRTFFAMRLGEIEILQTQLKSEFSAKPREQAASSYKHPGYLHTGASLSSAPWFSWFVL
jgi:hypothetical protein